MTIKLSLQQQQTIECSADIYRIMRPVFMRRNRLQRCQECLWVIGVTGSGHVKFVELVALGTLNRVAANAGDVFRTALLKGISRLILVHNHPCGNSSPSFADRQFTDNMKKAGILLGVQVLDHIILTEIDYLSFADEGLL